MERVRLTNERISAFACPEGKQQAFLWDSESPGLAVRATAGAKSFIFESKLHRKTIRITLGDVRSWGLNSVWSGKGNEKQEIQRGAREEASRLKTIIDQGLDPRKIADAERAAELAQLEDAAAAEQALLLENTTIGEAWQAYLDYQKGRMSRTASDKKWSARHLQDHERLAQVGGLKKQRGKGMTEPGPLASLMAKKISDLSQELIIEWLDSETTKRPTYTALAFRLFRAFLRWCSQDIRYQILINLDVINAKRVRDYVPTPKPKDGDCLQREQLSVWFKHVRQLSNPVISGYLQILLLTGARREELAGLKWEDVDFQWKSLTIRDKVDGERVIPLVRASERRSVWCR